MLIRNPGVPLAAVAAGAIMIGCPQEVEAATPESYGAQTGGASPTFTTPEARRRTAEAQQQANYLARVFFRYVGVGKGGDPECLPSPENCREGLVTLERSPDIVWNGIQSPNGLRTVTIAAPVDGTGALRLNNISWISLAESDLSGGIKRDANYVFMGRSVFNGAWETGAQYRPESPAPVADVLIGASTIPKDRTEAVLSSKKLHRVVTQLEDGIHALFKGRPIHSRPQAYGQPKGTRARLVKLVSKLKSRKDTPSN